MMSESDTVAARDMKHSMSISGDPIQDARARILADIAKLDAQINDLKDQMALALKSVQAKVKLLGVLDQEYPSQGTNGHIGEETTASRVGRVLADAYPQRLTTAEIIERMHPMPPNTVRFNVYSAKRKTWRKVPNTRPIQWEHDPKEDS
jgi:hypothetical protein